MPGPHLRGVWVCHAQECQPREAEWGLGGDNTGLCRPQEACRLAGEPRERSGAFRAAGEGKPPIERGTDLALGNGKDLTKEM